jgi:hypothetical protein
MFNSSLSLKFLKTGSELETLIHNSLDDTIKAIFSHHGRTKTISPSEIGTRTNTEYSFFKYFYNRLLISVTREEVDSFSFSVPFRDFLKLPLLYLRQKTLYWANVS